MKKGRLGSQGDEEKESQRPGGSEASLTKPFIPDVLVAGCQVGASGAGCLLSVGGIIQSWSCECLAWVSVTRGELRISEQCSRSSKGETEGQQGAQDSAGVWTVVT